jgi:hypothetical protein
MSITCLSLRESEAVGAAFSDLLDIRVTLIESASKKTKAWDSYAEKSTVLNFQQATGFVNSEFSAARKTWLVAATGSGAPGSFAVVRNQRRMAQRHHGSKARRLRSMSRAFAPPFSQTRINT